MLGDLVEDLGVGCGVFGRTLGIEVSLLLEQMQFDGIDGSCIVLCSFLSVSYLFLGDTDIRPQDLVVGVKCCTLLGLGGTLVFGSQLLDALFAVIGSATAAGSSNLRDLDVAGKSHKVLYLLLDAIDFGLC